jgi:hypothetical protein
MYIYISMYLYIYIYNYTYIFIYIYRLLTLANIEFGNTTISVSTKEYLFNFMSDMVLKIPYMVNSKQPGTLIISIEIDGMYMNTLCITYHVYIHMDIYIYVYFYLWF